MLRGNRAKEQRDSSFFRPNGRGRGERGMSLVIVAGSLFVLLGMGGLAIDLASLYVARSEAQRAADAGALAGAQAFVNSGFTSGQVSQSVAETVAAQQAASVGNQNLVGAQNPKISSSGFSGSCPPAAGSDGCFDFSNPADPRITVVVQRTTARSDPLPTFFMRIFGVESVDVSAKATAEAYNPSAPGGTGGSGPSISAICLKPWLIPNCDPNHTVAANDPNGNPNCPVSGGLAAYFVNPSTGQIVNPAPASAGGAIGEFLTIKPGNPQQATAPSKYYPIFLPASQSAAPSVCPACASQPGGGGPSSGALYRANIECCNVSPVVCTQQTVQPITGNMVGPTAQGVDCLIHEQNGTGMDILNTSTHPFQIEAGSDNPLVTSSVIPVNSLLSTSDSVVTLPLYDGVQLCPGNSCPNTVTVNTEGFMQMFVKDETNPQGTVEAYVLNITACPPGAGSTGGGGTGSGSGAVSVTGGGSGGSGSISGGGASPIPVRLIHN
jgi:Flp pilus assembly protein TadG